MLENLTSLNLEFLTYREFEPNNPHEREKIFSDPAILKSLTHMMKDLQVSPTDLPNYIALHQTTFDPNHIGDDNKAAAIKSTSDLNARKPLKLSNKKKKFSKGFKP